MTTLLASGITFDLGPFFDQVSHWFGELLPLLAVGLGVSVALALVAFIGRQFLMVRNRRNFR